MLTRFISQYDHGGYLCIGINKPLSLQESCSLPPSLVARGRLSRLLIDDTQKNKDRTRVAAQDVRSILNMC